MRTVSIIDKQITDYLPELNTVQKKAVLSVIKALKEDEEVAFEREMSRRFAELESGQVKGYSWDEAVAHARKSYNSLKKKK